MRIDRGIELLGNQVVGNRHAHRGKDQTHGIVHKEPDQVGLIDSGHHRQLRDHVPRHIDEGGPDHRPQRVPDGHIQILDFTCSHRSKHVDGKQHPAQGNHIIKRRRDFAVFNIFDVAQNDGCKTAQNRNIVNNTGQHTQLFGEELGMQNPRQNPEQQPDVGLQQPAVEVDVGVQHADTRHGKVFNVADRRNDKLERREQSHRQCGSEIEARREDRGFGSSILFHYLVSLLLERMKAIRSRMDWSFRKSCAGIAVPATPRRMD